MNVIVYLGIAVILQVIVLSYLALEGVFQRVALQINGVNDMKTINLDPSFANYLCQLPFPVLFGLIVLATMVIATIASDIFLKG